MPVFACRDCAELHTLQRKWSAYTGYGTCACTCPLCGNEGRTLCDACGGTGKAGLFGRVCKHCSGERTVVCVICRGFLAHPNCHICRGTSCETCFGTRSVELELILPRLKPVPRRRTVFRPRSLSSKVRRFEYPVYTYERLWKRLERVIDFGGPLSVSRELGYERVHLKGQLFAREGAEFWIYRFADNEYGVEERFSSHDWEEHVKAVAEAGALSR